MNKKKALFLFSIFTLVSCQKTLTTEKPENIVVDLKERQVSLKEETKSVCITFNIEEYLAIGGKTAKDKIVGWSFSYWKGRRNDAYKAYTSIYPGLLDAKDIGYGTNINIETILSLKPDVLIASSAVDYSFFQPHLALFEKAQIPVVFIDYHTDTIETIQKSNQVLGKVLNQEKRAEEITDYYKSKVSPIFEKAKTIKKEDRPNVYMEFSKGKDIYGNTWSKKMWGSLIEQVGGNNIAYDISDTNSVDMAKEAVISRNPDVIILTGVEQTGLNGNVVLGYDQDEEKAKKNLMTYLDRPEWKDIHAVTTRNLSAVYHDLSRHVFDFAGVEFLAKKIQPEAFSYLNPMEDLEEFFRLYMPFELKGCFMTEL